MFFQIVIGTCIYTGVNNGKKSKNNITKCITQTGVSNAKSKKKNIKKEMTYSLVVSEH